MAFAMGPLFVRKKCEGGFLERGNIAPVVEKGILEERGKAIMARLLHKWADTIPESCNDGPMFGHRKEGT